MPISSATRELRDDGYRQQPAAGEPQPELVIPVAPDHLDDDARQEWDRVTAELLKVRTIAELYRGPVAAYCVAYSRWVKAERMLASSGGEVIESPNGFPIQNPWLSIANKASAQMAKLAAEFGMTASSKRRVNAAPQETQLSLFAVGKPAAFMTRFKPA